MRAIICALVATILLLEINASSPIYPKHTPKLGSDQGYRLPTTARPTSYDLSLSFTFGEVPSATGEVTIAVTVDKKHTPNNILYLNSEVSFEPNANATFQKVDKTPFSCLIDSTMSGYIALNCSESIIGNGTVTIPFVSKIALDSKDGAFVSRFYEDDRKKYIVATQFEQDSARAVFPSFDEPEFKAPITLTLVTPTSSTYKPSGQIANTKVKSSSSKYGLTVTTFEPTPPMPTYLLAFILTEDFKNFSNASRKTAYDFSVFAQKSAEGYVNISLSNGPKLIDIMGTYVGIPYFNLGNSKMTLAAISEFSGAMENWGLITFRDTYLIDEGDATAYKDVQSITEVIAHELTHQWFGDYVTLDWWSDTFLNEGFAEFFEYYLTDQVLENAEMARQLIIKEQQPALKVDAYPDSIPLSNNASNVTTESDLSKEFGTISYSKGASVIKLINYTMGEDLFKKGLNSYLTTYNLSNTSPTNLIDALQAVLPKNGTNLTNYFSEWIYEAGYPVLEVSINSSSSNQVIIQSKRFSSSLDKSSDKNTTNWWIPLTYTTSDARNFTVNSETIQWVSPEDIQNYTLTISNESWIVVNLQSAGFYRVNYDDTLWNRLIDALKSESFGGIDVLNRAQLLDDVFNIARSYEGTEDEQREYYMRAFNLSGYLVNETEYHPWYTFFVEVQYLLDRIQDEETLDTLKEALKGLLDKQAEAAINATVDPKQTHIQVLRNNLLLNWACKLGHETCVMWAQGLFQNYTAGISIDNNYRDVVVCTGLANSKNVTTDYAFVLNKLNSTILPLEQNDLAKSLGCIKNKALTYQLIQETLKENRFSRMTYPTIFASLISDGTEKLIYTMKSVLGKDLDFNEKWKAIGSVETLLSTIGTKCFSNDCIEAIRNDYVSIYKNDTSRASMVAAANKAIDSIKVNLDWVYKYGDILTSVIVYGGTTTSPPTEVTSPTASGERIAFTTSFGCIVALIVTAFKTLYC